MSTLRYDVAVIGLGIVGAMATWRAAARGARVIGIEQYGLAHARGSSHGGSRIFRQTLFEGPDYVGLVTRSLRLWKKLGGESGQGLLRRSGGLCIGARDSALIANALESAELGGFGHELLQTDELFDRYPQHAFRDTDVAVFEPGAGVLNPEQCIATAIARAADSGAAIATETPVIALEHVQNGVRIHTGSDTIEARKAILATGAWFTRLVPDLHLSLKIQRSPLVWFTGRDREAYGPERFPCFIRKSGELDGWGIPDIDGRGVKVGVSSASSAKPYLDAPEDNRYPIDSRDTDPPEHFTRHAFPGLNPVAVAAEPCLNSKTPDRDFILGTTAAAPDIVLAGGFSGHGFKHAAASGDIAVDLALEGATELDLSRFDPDRLLQASVTHRPDDRRPEVAQ